MPGANLDPSSFIHATTSIGDFGTILFSRNASIISIPAKTPNTPSYFPPEG